MPTLRYGHVRQSGPDRPTRWYRAGRWQVVMVGGVALFGGVFFAALPHQGSANRSDRTLVVRRGGTYSGSYRSSDSLVPCISIETSEPVTLQGCVLTGAGNLIHANAGNAQLTVVNCRGLGLQPSRDQTRRGRFLEVSEARSVRVEHNYFDQTTGISVYRWSGDGSAGQTLTIRYNQCHNLDGRLRDGGEKFCNFLGLNGVSNLSNVEIAWNEVINEPDKSLVADNINFYNSGGTRRSPLRLHDNYIQGAYPYPAAGSKYAGSGVTLDGDGRAALTATAYVDGYQNQIISTCNAAMNIAAGHDNHFHNNRMVACGRQADGVPLAANWAATAIWNAYKQPPDVFYNNRISHNVIGYVRWSSNKPFANRQDLSPDACTPCTATTHLPNPITLQTEQAEWTRWQQKLRRQRQWVGPAATVGPHRNQNGQY